MRKITDIDTQAIACDHCRGLADYIYFNGETKEVISIICTDCRTAFEATIQSIGKSYSEATRNLMH